MSKKLRNRYEQYRTWLEKSPTLAKGLEQKQIKDVSEGIDTYVLGPSLNGFVLWVLQDAQRKGIQRLYFLARDGYFMYRCATVLCEQLNIAIDCRYLYCSRYSLRIPSYHLNMQDAMEYICKGGIDVTRRKIVERSGIGKEEQREVLEILGYSRNADEIVPYARLGEIRKELEECETFQRYTQQNSQKNFPILKDYLIQEKLLEDNGAALVDSGWVGSMQKTLNRVLKELGRNREVEGYYWGLYELPEGASEKYYYCYYFSPKKGLKEKVYFSNCLFEAVFSAPHGMTVGYEKQEDKIVPVLEQFSQERKAFLEKTESYLMQYTEHLAGNLTRQVQETGWGLAKLDCASDVKIVKRLMAEFMGHPLREEAEVYGKLRFSDDIMDDARKQVAEPLNEKELRDNHVINKALHMLGIRHGYIKESAWYEGSAALAGECAEVHRRQYALYKYLLYIRQSYLKRRK